MYCFWAIHDRGRYFEIFCYLCFLFHYLLIYIYELFMIYVFILCFVNKEFIFVLLVFSTHTFMCLLSISKKIQVDSVMSYS